MKRILYTALFLMTFSIIANAQILISGPDYPLSNPCTCASAPFIGGSTPNFFDTGGSGGNYSANENQTITFCPDANGSKMSIAIGNNAGYVWDVDGSDLLSVYDGQSTASPLLWAGNSVTHPNGVSAGVTTASWTNTSGCITIQFTSDGANEAQGWAAFLSCGTPWQPFEMHMTGSIGVGQANGAGDGINDMAPLDTGYVDICLGDSILFTATPIFPYEPGAAMGAINGGGYNQSNNYTVQWAFSDGNVATSNQVWFKPTTRAGYFVELRVQDANGQFGILNSKVRVSTVPSFVTCEAIPDTICLGQNAQLVGGITQTDTAGVNGTATNFQINGSFGQQLYLPDGSGANYTTAINISGFPAGSTLQSIGDLEKICIDIEHSYLGDLEMMLTCPSGQFINVFNAYTGNGLFPGGFGGGGTFLGGANDLAANGIIGICETYCFSNNPGSLPSWNNGYNTVPTSFPAGAAPIPAPVMVAPGTYNPEQAFIPALSGCPLNGTWTLTIRDNLNVDDGFVCSWGIYFNASLNPNNETYQPYFVNEFWSPSPTIVTTIDTLLIVKPVNLGNTFYTFNVVDNFGCSYDTTIRVNAIAGPTILPYIEACFGETVNYIDTYAPLGGVWSYTGPGNVNFFTAITFINPVFIPDTPGEYLFSFNDNLCNETLTSTVVINNIPTALIISENVICQGDTAVFLIDDFLAGVNYTWLNSSGNVISNQPILGLTTSGLYTLNASNQCGIASDTASLLVEICEIPNIITPNGDGINDVFYTRYAENYTDVNLIIYNRWGRIVYKKDSYQNNWSGQTLNDNTVADGVYYFVMTWDNGTKNEAGTITVMGAE